MVFFLYFLTMLRVKSGFMSTSGRSMKDSHAHLDIADNEWQAMVADFKKTLDEFKVPAKEQGELIAIVESTRPDIVMGVTKK
ncbi:MAG TPA: hypothetical protein VGA99_13080 [bacterium]